VRSWKQIIKFQHEGELPKSTPKVQLPFLQSPTSSPMSEESAFVAMAGVVRDERGLVFEREESD